MKNLKQENMFENATKELLPSPDGVEFCLAAVQRNGIALIYVPEVKRTEAICLIVVQYHGYALQHIHDALRTETVCLTAVQERMEALRYVPEALHNKIKATLTKNGSEDV